MRNPVLTYYQLSPGVTAFSSTRQGGCSQGSYAEFNVNLYCGDRVEAIAANRQSLCRLLGIDEARLVMPHQVHGTVVRPIDRRFLALPEAGQSALLEGVDALMTDVPDVCIGVSTADCIPVLLYDPANRAVCAVHAGWRGTVQHIVSHAVAAMRQTYNTRPADLRAVIGPGISLDSFEVGDEVYDQFAAAGFPMRHIARQYPTRLSAIHTPHSTLHAPQQKWHIDLWACNRMQLEEAGVRPDNIQVAGICTWQHSDEYFSARRLGIQSGRILTGILLK